MRQVINDLYLVLPHLPHQGGHPLLQGDQALLFTMVNLQTININCCDLKLSQLVKTEQVWLEEKVGEGPRLLHWN